VDADVRRFEERKFVMPVKGLPPNANLDHLKYQAKDLMKAHAGRDTQVAQRIREFHPKFEKATDNEIFKAKLMLSDAQLAIARERGFASWARLKRHIEKPTPADNLQVKHHERIEDFTFRKGVDLLDAGDVKGLSAHLKRHPNLVSQHVTFEGGNYFRNPTLLEFAAENPIRHGKLPTNIVDVMKVILEAGAKNDKAAMNETLGLVCSGRVPRECGVQVVMIDLLCSYGADPNAGMGPALPHGELEAVEALIRNGAKVNLVVAATLGRVEDARRTLAPASADDRLRALALAAQFGHTEIVRLLLDAGEDPNRYNPMGNHSHSTPLHQAAVAGHFDTVRLLVERGARLDLKDVWFDGTPRGWAEYAGHKEIAQYLREHEK
jgi:Ankyrin repeats (3 copies)